MSRKTFITLREQKALFVMLGIGIAGFAVGLYLEVSRLWPSYLLNAFYFLSLALGATVFLSIHHVSNAGWSACLRRVPEVMMSYLPVGALSMLAIIFGVRSIYKEWVGVTFEAHNHPLTLKNAYLTTPFFFARMAVILAVWVALAHLLRRESHLQDADGNLLHIAKSKKYSAIFLAAFAVTFTISSFDWLMSIEPLFYSTIYAFYVISGLLLSGIAAITALVIALRRRGLLKEVNENHLHSLGKLLFGFSTFWAYIWLCQYLLIYYANLPEETVYYYRRMVTPGWHVFFWLNVFLNWLIPFALLLSRKAKRSEGWLLMTCGVVLIGHWVDLYLMIFPVFEWSPMITLVDVALLLGFASLFLQSFARGVKQVRLLPLNDPYLGESLWREPHESLEVGLAWNSDAAHAKSRAIFN
jgi:hypothetical protein